MANTATAQLSFNSEVELFYASWRRQSRNVLEVLGWIAVLLLIFVGLSSLFSRVGFMVDAFSQEIADLNQVFDAFNVRYVQHYFMVWSHLVLGFVVFAFAPFQFIPAIRNRWINFHRWNGRVWMVSGATAAFTGSLIGIVWSFTGHQGFRLLQTAINAIIGPYTLFCLYKAYSCIRMRNIGAHREWIIRSFALILGVSTQRVLMLIFIPFTGISMEVFFATAMVLGMVINISIGEFWIQLTRTTGNGNRHWKVLDKKGTASI